MEPPQVSGLRHSRRRRGSLRPPSLGPPASSASGRAPSGGFTEEEQALAGLPLDVLIQTLEEQVNRAANRLGPDFAFPARCLRHKLEAIRKRFLGKRAGKGTPIHLLGELAKTFRDLARAIDAMAENDRPGLSALRPFVAALIGRLGDRTDLEGEHAGLDGEWPPGARADLRERLLSLVDEIEALDGEAVDDDDSDALHRAEASAEAMLGEVERPRPDWRNMRDESRELVRALRPGLDPDSALGQLHGSAGRLFSALGEVVEGIVAQQADLAGFRDFSDTPELVILPVGPFDMGSPESEPDRRSDEGPQHEVRIARRFALGRYPVTFEEYDRFTGATGRERASDESWGRGRRPVINVSWEDAQAYAAWLSGETGKAYRLPSEAEWEYACRAGTTTRYSWGNEITPENANYNENVGKTTEVGAYPANTWGLHDMHGNVWEWCEDVWHKSYDEAPGDGTAWIEGGEQSRRVLRGGSWFFDPEVLRSAVRSRNSADFRGSSRGFRVARTLR